MKALHLVFMGTPLFAVPVLELLRTSRHHLAAVVTQPDRPRARGRRICFSPVKEWAVRHGVEVLQPARLLDDHFWERLRAINPALIVTAAYGKLLPPKLLQYPPLGCINLHASLLPAYRGAAPIHRAVMEGAARSGVTVMEMAPEMDAGNIIMQMEEPIALDDTAGTLHDRLAEAGARLLLQAVDALAAGTATSRPQDPAAISYAPPLRPEEEIIDWHRGAVSLHNQVRGMNPWPGAYTICGGKRLKVRRTALPEQLPEKAFPPAPPGTIFCTGGKTLYAATGDGPLALLEVQPDGKRPMSGGEFYCGRRFEPGCRLGT
ncbi:MAG: methionyl-tRNA formyltransferase [Bacillota bacterium]